MTRQINQIHDELNQEQELRLTSEEVRIKLIELEVKDNRVWEVFKYCPSSALKIATDNRYQDMAKQIYDLIESCHIEESVAQFLWELFNWSPDNAFRYLETFDKRLENSRSKAYKIQLEKELKKSKF